MNWGRGDDELIFVHISRRPVVELFFQGPNCWFCYPGLSFTSCGFWLCYLTALCFACQVGILRVTNHKVTMIIKGDNRVKQLDYCQVNSKHSINFDLI